MKTLDEFKNQWKDTRSESAEYDAESIKKIVKEQAKKNLSKVMQYFWASFVYQIIVYSCLVHVMVRYFQNTEIFLMSLLGVALLIPFTIMLIKKFKRAGFARAKDQQITSLQAHIAFQRNELEGFFRFKKWYELFLVPISSALGVVITFNLFVPGGVLSHPIGAWITYGLTLLSCWWAIRSENQKSFIQPLDEMKILLSEFSEQG